MSFPGETLLANRVLFASRTMGARLAILTACFYIVSIFPSFGQTYTIQTVAGGGLPNNVPGSSARLSVATIALDTHGNIFLASRDDHCVFRLDASTGVLTVIAGNDAPGFSGDGGPAINAQLNGPSAIALDPAGDLFIADTGNSRIRMVANGVITTVVGNGTVGFSGDGGAASSAELDGPSGLAMDPAGNLYISDTGNHRIREVSNGVITTVAGGGESSSFPGSATGVFLNSPQGLAVDTAGNVYIADPGILGDFGTYGGSMVLELSNGQLSVVAGGPSLTVDINPPGGSPNPCNGQATDLALAQPEGVAVDSSGNVYVADPLLCLFEVTDGTVTRLNSSGSDVPWSSTGIAVDAQGNLYLAYGPVGELSGGVFTTLAGLGALPQIAPATGTELREPSGLWLDSSGDLYFVDTGNSRIAVLANGVVTNLIGNGMPGSSASGTPATSAEISGANSVAVDSEGNLYFSGEAPIFEVSGGVLSTVLVNGPTLQAESNLTGHDGNVYFLGNSPTGNPLASPGPLELLELSNGKPVLVAETQPVATSAQGIAIDSAGNVYAADVSGTQVFVLSHGLAALVAGVGGLGGFSGDGGPATSARLNAPVAVALDANGNLYIADAVNNRIRKVTNGVITTIAGTGTPVFSGDGGTAPGAAIFSPQGIAVDNAGNVYFSDTNNNRIRELIPSGPSCSSSVSLDAISTAAEGGAFSITIQTGASCPWAIESLPSWIAYPGETLGTGSAALSLRISDNSSGQKRSALILIAGKPVFVAQDSRSLRPARREGER